MTSPEKTKPQAAKLGASETTLPGGLRKSYAIENSGPRAEFPGRWVRLTPQPAKLRKALDSHSTLMWAPPPRTITLGRLHALRMLSAWRVVRAWLPTASSPNAALRDLALVLPMNKRMLAAPLPLRAPPFEFDELDAARMVLDAMSLELRSIR